MSKKSQNVYLARFERFRPILKHKCGNAERGKLSSENSARRFRLVQKQLRLDSWFSEWSKLEIIQNYSKQTRKT